MYETQPDQHRPVLGRCRHNSSNRPLSAGHSELGGWLIELMRTVNVKYVLLFVAFALALLVSWYYWGSTRTPPGQPPLTSLTPSNLEKFNRQFNDAADRARLLLLLSPT
jgi:hypothetical protein